MSPAMIYIFVASVMLSGVLCQVSTTNKDDDPPYVNTVKINDFYGFMDLFTGFTCEAMGSNLDYFWKHKDQLLTKDSPLKFPKLNASTLQPIKQNIQLDYEGPYQCFAVNSIGTVFGRRARVKFTVVGQFTKDSTKLETMRVKLNDHYALPCPEHRYSHNVRYKWEYLDAHSDPQSLRPSTEYFVTDNGTLYFSTITKDTINYIKQHGGIRCTQRATFNGVTRSRSSHRIILEQDTQSTGSVKPFAPSIKVSGSTVSVKSRTSAVSLSCGAIGNPTPNLTWFREDINNVRTKIVNDDTFQLARFNQILGISDITTNKAGKYVCVAENSLGFDEETNHINVQDRPQWTVGGELTDVEPPIDSTFQWKCMALGGATFTWYKNGVKLDGTSAGEFDIDAKVGQSYATLTIKKVTVAYNGMYQCTAANEKDTIYSTGRLKVKIKPPEFFEAMGPVTLIQTKSGSIPCPVDAAPLPTITWKKDKLVLDVDGDDNLELAANNRDLVIKKVTAEDKGEYSCRAKNTLGSISGTSQVQIGIDITWVQYPLHDGNVTKGLKFELDCNATGDPSYEVKYRWLRNGLPLEYSARIQWEKEARKLVILDSLVSDTGTYTCIAFAETPHLIAKQHDALVEVKDRPDPPDLVKIEGSCWIKDATVVWRTASLNNEGELQHTLIDWATTYEPANWTRLARKDEGRTNSGTELKLNFDKLPPFSHVMFRVILVNRLGESDPSEHSIPSDCITPPSVPRYAPEDLRGEPGKANELNIVWTPVRRMYWGAPGFRYLLQLRRKTKDRSESRWDRGTSHWVTIEDGHNSSYPVENAGYYNEWEFRIRSENRNGTSDWSPVVETYSGQDGPKERPSGLHPDNIRARSADISWGRVTPTKNGSIEGYKIKYWYSVHGVDISYDSASSDERKRVKRDVNRVKREDDEEEDDDDERFCFDPKDPCLQISAEKESQLNGLRPFKKYHIEIAAFNSGGDGPYSTELTFETEDDTPGEPYAVLAFAYGKYAKITWKQPRHTNGIITGYEVSGIGIVKVELPWWARRHVVYGLDYGKTYEAKVMAKTGKNNWGEQTMVWFTTKGPEKPAKPLTPEASGYGEDSVNVTFMEPKPTMIRKLGGEIYDDPWEYRPVGGFENEHYGTGGYPETFYVLYRRAERNEEFKKSERKQLWGEKEQTWIVIDGLERFMPYEFITVPVNYLGEGPRSDPAMALPGGIIPRVKKLHWYQRDWFIALTILFGAALLLLLIIVLSTNHIKSIYYEGAPKRRKQREKERIYEPEDVTGGFDDFTVKSARSSRSVVTSRSGPPPAYSATNGSTSRHSGEFEEDSSDADSDDDKNTYYSDDKKVPLDDLDEDDEEDSKFATFV